jgi:PEGA domain-containing protein
LNERPIGLHRRALAGLIAGALALSQTPCAWAQEAEPNLESATQYGRPDLSSAKKHYTDARIKFRAGDFAGALADFQVANRIKATPQAERYIGRCLDALGQFPAATEWYDRFLAHVPRKMGPQGDRTRTREEEIKGMPGKVHIESNPPGATVTIDDKPESAPTPTDVELAPGLHRVQFTEPKRLPAQKSIAVPYASTQTVIAKLEPKPSLAPPAQQPIAEEAEPSSPPDPPPSPAEPRGRGSGLAYAAGGLAVVAAGVGAVFGIVALNDKGEYERNPTTQNADNRSTHALFADVALGAALTFGVMSGVLFLTNGRSTGSPNGATQPSLPKAAGVGRLARPNAIMITPTPLVSPHGGGAGIVVRF